MNKIGFVLMLLGAVLAPGIFQGTGYSAVRAEDVVLVGIGLYWMTKPSGELARAMLGDRMSVVFVLMWLVVVCSMISGTVIASNPLSVRDFLFFGMLIKYWLIFRLGQSAARPPEQKWVLVAAVCVFGLSGGVGICEHYNALGANTWLTPLYRAGAPTMTDLSPDEQVSLARRVVGTHGDPRYYGYFLSVGYAVCLATWLLSRPWLLRWLALVSTGCIVASLLFCASRIATLSLIAMTGVLIGLAFRNYRTRQRTLVAACVFAVLCLASAYISLNLGSGTPSTFQQRVLKTDGDSFRVSYSVRVRDTMIPINAALQNPVLLLFGLGPSKETLRTSNHSDLGWFLARFGILGLGFLLFLLRTGLVNAYRRLRKAMTWSEQTMTMASLGCMVTWSIFVLGENIFKDPRMMTLNMLFLGAVCPLELRKRLYPGPKLWEPLAQPRYLLAAGSELDFRPGRTAVRRIPGEQGTTGMKP